MTTNGGDVKTCAGQTVYLTPYNQYVAAVNNAVIAGTPTNENYDLVLANQRTTTCDASGNFEFDSLPSGTWLVSTKVTWNVAGQYGLEPQGGRLQTIVAAKPGSNKVVMPDSDLEPR